MSLTVNHDDSIDGVLRTLPVEELRLALVLNGGVSLAVWMGGVAHEINRLTRADDTHKDGYGPILLASRTSVSVDVIAGTSAGGINGAALALAQVNEHADLLGLRRLWAEQGRMEELLRSPFQGKPSSLLRGDDYFLPELNRAMRMLAHPFKPRARRTPVDLTLTTTLLKGSQEVTVDDFGEQIPQRLHAATFRFSNIGRDGRDGVKDPFAEENIGKTADAMALAARCTASFPFAFEPSFVPVGEDPPSGDTIRPRMDDYASWYSEGAGVQSRYAMDGGVLANTPVAPALQAIERRQADGPVRRSMLLVFPHAPKAAIIEPDKSASPPRAVGALAGVLGALQAQGSRSFVERIEEHNRRAGDWRGGRRQLLSAIGSDANPVSSLYALLFRAWPQYQHVRIRLAARGLADKVESMEQWPYERIRMAAETAQQAWVREQPDRSASLPYVPAGFAYRSAAWRSANIISADAWHWGDTPARGVGESVAAVLRSALSVVTDEATRARLSAARERVGKRINEIDDLRRTKIDQVWLDNEYLRSLPPTEDYWRARIVAYELAMDPMASHGDELEGLLPEPPEGSARSGGRAALLEARAKAIEELRGRNGAPGLRVRAAIGGAVSELVSLESALTAIGRASADVSDLKEWSDFLFSGPRPGEPARLRHRLLLRLLALDAGTRLLAEGTATGSDLPVRLAELSLRLEHPWARYSLTPDDKAAGLALGRFGGFLKRSWRMNDWTWGRLDAVTMLCQTVLEPNRIRRVAAMSRPGVDAGMFAETYFNALKANLYGGAELPPDMQHLQEEALEELELLLDPDKPDLRYLPALARWVALPLQAEIILQELPVLASAIEVDVDEGAGQPTRGTRFLTDQKEGVLKQIADAALATQQPTAQARLTLGCTALRAFDAAGIGREPIAEETGSNSLIRTASKAAGVLATVLDSDAEKAPAVKPITSAVRGALLLPYWMINGLAGGGSIARFLATAGLVVGGLLVALSLFGVLGSSAAAAGTAGTAAVLAALAYSALKTGSLLHAGALLAPVGPLAVYALTSNDTNAEAAATRVLVVLAAVLALYVLASIPWPLASPAAGLGLFWRGIRPRLVKRYDRLWWQTANVGDRCWKAVVLVLFVLVIAAAAWLLAEVASWLWDGWLRESGLLDWLSDAMAGVRDSLFAFESAWWLWQLCGIVVVVLLGFLLAYRQGALLRTWRGLGTGEATFGNNDGLSGTFGTQAVSQPAGVAASWAPIYGAAHLLAAVLVFQLVKAGSDRDEPWVVFTMWWLGTLGLVLCLVAPVPVARAARSRVRRLMQRSWVHLATTAAANGIETVEGAAAEGGEPSAAQRLLFALMKYDLLYRYLAEASSTDAQGAATELRLTRQGRRLYQWLERQSS